MTKILRTLLCATIFFTMAFFPAISLANVTFQVIRGSGEFQTLETNINVFEQEKLTFQWSTDQLNVAGGKWQITLLTTGKKNQVVASGNVDAPLPGKVAWFTIAANVFLKTSTTKPLKFSITIVPHNAGNQLLGSRSSPVRITQMPVGEATPVVFEEGKGFPFVEMINYEEKVGTVNSTQIQYAGADVKIRVSNKSQTATDPVLLSLNDANILIRQNAPKVNIESLKPGTSKEITIHMDAVLPPPTSQMPQEVQYNKWKEQYRDRCGVDLRVLMDWRGPQAQTPINSHMERVLPMEGWIGYPNSGSSSLICKGPQCVSLCQITKNIRSQLDGHVVGYSLFVGPSAKFESNGYARTRAEDVDRVFSSTTKIPVASVSKMVTTIAAVRILANRGISLDAAIGPFLPANWKTDTFVKKITFAQLLSQTSGIKDYGNTSNDYAVLQQFFSQPVSKSNATICQPADTLLPMGAGFNPNIATTRRYSNYNFSIFRILLPKVAGFAEDPNLSTRPKTLADQYIRLVQQNVFEPVGQMNVDCKPPSAGADYALAYSLPSTVPGKKTGYDFGDNSLGAGGAGWYLSVEDIAKVLMSINAKDGRILSASPGNDQFDIMQTRQLGWDVRLDQELQKNGGWSAQCDTSGQNCKTISTSIAIFGPVKGPRVVAVLFINSNVFGGASNGMGARGILENAYNKAVFNK